MVLSDYEDTLHSFIHDDDKLVTYKWLSKELDVHVNLSKDILKEYWEKHKDTKSIVATFLLIGQLKNNSIRVEIVKDVDLCSAKGKFFKVDCEHLYSLQKCLPNIELLASIDAEYLRYSGIKCNEEFLRSDEEVEKLRYIGNVKKQDVKFASFDKLSKKEKEKEKEKEEKPKEKTKQKDVDFFKNKSTNSTNKEKSINEEDPIQKKEKVEEATEASTQKKISPTNKSNSNTQNNNKTTKKPVQSKQAGFNNLFGKVSSKPKTLSKIQNLNDDEKQKNSSDYVKNQEKHTENDNKTNILKEEVSNKCEKKEQDQINKEKENRNEQLEVENKNDKTNSKNKTKNKNKNIRGTKRNRSQDGDTKSKRKRIVVIESSEDESPKSSNDEDEAPMDYEEEQITNKVLNRRSPSPPIEKRENGKRMVRKTVDKTYKDEDGYLVTKRVHIYEAVSDNDDDSSKSRKEEPVKQKPVESKMKKQTSLMSFFKKS